eukprot:GSMAST32.ASY1.ANO1.2357.1 assembled CDS
MPLSLLGSEPRIHLNTLHVMKIISLPPVLVKQLSLLSCEQNVRQIVTALFQLEVDAMKSADTGIIDDIETKTKFEINKSIMMEPLTARTLKKKTSAWEFMQSTAKWAKTLLHSKTLSSRPTSIIKQGPLTNTTSLSYKLATSTAKNIKFPSVMKKTRISIKRKCAIFSICTMWNRQLQADVTTAGDKSALLNTLSFSTPFPQVLWLFMDSTDEFESSINEYHPQYSSKNFHSNLDICQALAIFCQCLSHLLLVVDDVELHEKGKPLHLHEIIRIIAILKKLLLFSNKTQNEKNQFPKYLLQCICCLMQNLYERNGRQPICKRSEWLADNNILSMVRNDSKLFDQVLRDCSYLVSFEERIKIFESKILKDKTHHQPKNAQPYKRILVRRDSIFADSFRELFLLKKNIRKRISVTFIASNGIQEKGQDLGGLFKELWNSISEVAFDPFYGLFKLTDDGLLYPNPDSEKAIGENTEDNFEFLGQILGKALYENLVVQPRFARHFLRKLLGKENYLDDLVTYKFYKELFKNLIFLKNMKENVSDLCLDFTVTDCAMGENRTIELFPGGSSVEVHENNRFKYTYLLANYHLNQRTAKQVSAFKRGLYQIINSEWLKMYPELQILISGDATPVDVEDLRKYTKVEGALTNGPFMRRFWKTLTLMSHQEKCLLLKFVTSSSSPPRLGFQSLEPKFCVRCVTIRSDNERLPTASTCFNVLKLPNYSSSKVMKNKLLYVITSKSGFDL